MCINFFSFFLFCLLSPLFFSSFSFHFSFSLAALSLSLLCSLSLSALLSLPQSQVNSSVEVVVDCQRLGGGGCGLVVVRWWLVVVSGSVGDGLIVVSGSVGDGDARRWWDLCLGGCHGIRWLISFPLLGCGCRQNVGLGLGLPAWVWRLWVWVCRRGCGGYGWLLLIGLLRLWLIGCRGFGWSVKKNI